MDTALNTDLETNIRQNIPAELRRGEDWVAWKGVPKPDRPGKMDKKPVVPNPLTFAYADHGRPETWGTLNDALWAADEHKLNGVGKVFHDDNPEEEDDLIGVDLDRVRDKDTGEVAGWAMNIVERFETYAEVSPSGTGIKLWIFGKLPGKRRRNDAVGVEVYSDKRFFTLTGERLPQAPKRVNKPASELLEAFYVAVFGEPTDGNGAGKPTTRRSPEMADQKIMAMLRSDAGAERFAAAYDDGDITAWADNQSSADLYLAKRIAFYTQDSEQVERIFGGSALARRPKWTDREDYRERTIMGAISSLKETYQPKREVDDRPGVEVLRDRMLGRVKGKLCYSMGAWQEYGHGVWRTIREDRALSVASDVIEEAVPEGIKYSWHLVTGVASAARLKLGVPDEVWDSEPDRLAFTNGTLDLRTFEFSEHSPDHYTTAGVPYDYDPDATGPMWDRYVRYLRESLDPETTGFIQEYLGYCLTAETDEEKMLFLVGPRGSGKSTLIEGVEAMLGPDLSTTRSLDGLQERFGRVGIVGKRVIVSKEMKALKLLETDLVSSIVSGEKIPIEHKGRDSFDYRPVAKVIQAANNLPRVPNTEAGIYRRLQVVQFPHLPESERDKGVKEGIRQEGPRVLNWALDGLARLRERGGLEVSERVRRASKEWYNDNDTVGMFFSECLEEGTKKIPATRIHDLYTLWSKQRGYGTLAATPFFVRANALGFYKEHLKKPKNIKTLCGVDLTDEGHKINESGYRPAIDYASL